MHTFVYFICSLFYIFFPRWGCTFLLQINHLKQNHTTVSTSNRIYLLNYLQNDYDIWSKSFSYIYLNLLVKWINMCVHAYWIIGIFFSMLRTRYIWSIHGNRTPNVGYVSIWNLISCPLIVVDVSSRLKLCATKCEEYSIFLKHTQNMRLNSIFPYFT